jgi:hypothetical protein
VHDPLIVNQNVSSHGQAGGVTAHTVNLGSPKRSLSDPRSANLKQQILKEAPRNRRINISVIFGDPEAYAFAREIFDFMKGNGFDVWGMDQVGLAAPLKGIVVNPQGEMWEITVGSAE